METEYVSFHPPRTTAMKMAHEPWFVGSFAGSWWFEEIAPGRMPVGLHYGLGARPRGLSWLLTPILPRAFARDTRDRPRALRQAVEGRGLPPP